MSAKGEVVLPRTRPANRRALIVDAATELFIENGFENVSMSEVAAAVGVGPSALYRHFANKQSLLAEVFGAYADGLVASMDQGVANDPLAGLVDLVAANRFAGRLWIRESRRLPDEIAEPIRESVLLRLDTLLGSGNEGSVRARSVAVLGVLLSVATHTGEPSTISLRELLSVLVQRAGTGSLGAPHAVVDEEPGGLRRAAKREHILAAAVDLFAERTYAGVGMEDIAGAVNLASSSIYNHFSGKNEILAAAMHRANGFIQVELDDILAAHTDARSALEAAVTSYAGFSVRHPGLVQVIISEISDLQGSEAVALRDAQRGYVDEWTHLSEHLEGLDTSGRRTTVLAAITAINNLVRAREVLPADDPAGFVAGYGRRVLGL